MLGEYHFSYYAFAFCSFYLLMGGKCTEVHVVESDVSKPEVFYYFGFGSNLLLKRLRLKNPTAVAIGPAVLQNYRLDFANWSEFWNGTVPNILPQPNATTWGVLYQINMDDLRNLDKQEEVPTCYRRISVPVTLLSNGTSFDAYTYVLVNTHDDVSYERRPSKTLLKVMVKGATESGLPNDYIHKLQNIDHTDAVIPNFEQQWELEDVELVDKELRSTHHRVTVSTDPHFQDIC